MRADLAEVSIPKLAAKAQALVRAGELNGWQALALIVWPEQERMEEFLQFARNRAERLSKLERCDLYAQADRELVASLLAELIADEDAKVPRQIRLQHAHSMPIAGLCKAFINLGPRWESRVRCSHRASVGDYCGTHAKRVAA